MKTNKKVQGIINELFDRSLAYHDAQIATDYFIELLIKYLPSSAGNPPNLQENEYNREWWIRVQKEMQC